LTSFSGAVIDNAPMLLTAALDAIMELVEGLTGGDGIRRIVDAAVNIIKTLTSWLVNNAGEVGQAAGEIIIELAKAIISNIPKIIEAGGQIIASLFMALIEGTYPIIDAGTRLLDAFIGSISKMLSKVVQKGREIVANVKNGVLSAVSSLADAGMNLVRGIWNGISNGLGWIKGKISGWVGNVVSFIKGLFGIHSPSAVMRDEVGVFLAKGIGVGFEKEMPNVEKLMQDSMPDLSSSMRFNVSPSFGSTSARSSDGGLAAEIAALREDVRNMRIYLDTGVLVGAVNDDMGTGVLAAKRRAFA
jgi:phage-related protein